MSLRSQKGTKSKTGTDGSEEMQRIEQVRNKNYAHLYRSLPTGFSTRGEIIVKRFQMLCSIYSIV